jgi:zinc transport system ATP-binding protein
VAEQPIIRIQNVSFSYGRLPVLEDINMEVFPKDFMGIVGPNGGGKTTLLKLVLGLLRPHRGAIAVFETAPRAARSQIGYVPQHTRFDPEFPITVEELVMTGRLRSGRLGRAYTEEDRAAALRAMAELDLTELALREVGALSGGERQRALVARALACEPRILMLDEPTASVDSRIEQNFYDLLRRLNERITILLVSHDLGFISAYVTKVACVNRRLVVNPADQIPSLDANALYEGPVKMWSHQCKL